LPVAEHLVDATHDGVVKIQRSGRIRRNEFVTRRRFPSGSIDLSGAVTEVGTDRSEESSRE
jgi:hypothetical protein